MVRYLLVFLVLWAGITIGLSTWRQWTRAAAKTLVYDATLALVGAGITFAVLGSIVAFF